MYADYLLKVAEDLTQQTATIAKKVKKPAAAAAKAALGKAKDALRSAEQHWKV